MKEKDDIGPFNACDYRCERCDKTDECTLNKRERSSRLMHLLKGEDPNDPAVWAEDMGAALAEAHELIGKAAEEMGVDLAALAEAGRDEYETASKAAHEHPLFLQAMDFAKSVPLFCNACEQTLLITPEIQQDFDELLWNHTLIPAKAGRALMQRGQSEAERDDRRKTIGVILAALAHCREALEHLLLCRPEGEALIASLAEMIEEMERAWREQQTR
jgi:hypothetical protein